MFADFVGKFIHWGLNAAWTFLEIVIDVVSPQALVYIKKTGAALKSILKNPLPFVGNLVKAAKLGLQNFADHFGTHLKEGLIAWLTGALQGVYIPQALSLVEIGKFALSVLGLAWAQIRAKIVKALGPTGEKIMSGLEKAADFIVALVTGGPAALWELIKEKLTDLKDAVIDGIKGFVESSIVKVAIPKLVAMFIPGAGFISAIISIYGTIKSFIEQLSRIAAAITAFIDSIVAIAAGQIAGAAKKVENALAGVIAIAIGLLAGFLGLGGISSKVMDVVKKVQATVDKALDAAITWLIDKAKAAFAWLFGKDKDGKPDQRTPEEKQEALDKAIGEAESLQKKPDITVDELANGLAPLKTKYKMTALDLIVDSKDKSKETVHIVGEINPKKPTNKSEIATAERPAVLKGKSTPNLDELETHEEGVAKRYVDDFKTYDGEKYKEVVSYVEQRAARKLGRIKEQPGLTAYGAAGGATSARNTKTIEILRVRGRGYSVERERIPDIYVEGAAVGDVKNVKEQSLDAQMQDNVRIANADRVRLRGKEDIVAQSARFDLVVRAPKDGEAEGTHVSGPLKASIAATGGAIFEVI
jgi:hypothetical protein